MKQQERKSILRDIGLSRRRFYYLSLMDKGYSLQSTSICTFFAREIQHRGRWLFSLLDLLRHFDLLLGLQSTKRRAQATSILSQTDHDLVTRLLSEQSHDGFPTLVNKPRVKLDQAAISADVVVLAHVAGLLARRSDGGA